MGQASLQEVELDFSLLNHGLLPLRLHGDFNYGMACMTCFVISTDPLLTHHQFFSENTGFKNKILTLPIFYKALYDPVANTFSLLPIKL